MPTMLAPLPSLAEQAQRLIELELHHHAGLSESYVLDAAEAAAQNALLVINADRVASSVLAPMLRHGDRPGFVVEDMADLDLFTPIEVAVTPDAPLYLVHDITRGDEMANWSPDEALPALISAGRTPLTVAEGIHWLLQQPAALERNHCFMTIGSRLRRSDGRLDARTPALWLSNGTGRDGAARRHAPKVGWCWAGNRHTWLGFASASRRSVT